MRNFYHHFFWTHISAWVLQVWNSQDQLSYFFCGFPYLGARNGNGSQKIHGVGFFHFYTHCQAHSIPMEPIKRPRAQFAEQDLPLERESSFENCAINTLLHTLQAFSKIVAWEDWQTAGQNQDVKSRQSAKSRIIARAASFEQGSSVEGPGRLTMITSLQLELAHLLAPPSFDNFLLLLLLKQWL